PPRLFLLWHDAALASRKLTRGSPGGQPTHRKSLCLDDVHAIPDRLIFDTFQVLSMKGITMAEEYTQPRPTLNADDNAVKEARDAVARLVAALQAGWDQHDADISDRHLAADVAWGSPYGATVHGYEQ